MGDPLIATTTAGSSAKALSYVALRSHEGKRVILPVAAAAGSRILHGLFQGVCVMQLHQSAETGNEEDARHGAAAAAVEEAKTHESNAALGVDKDEADGAAYRSYAACFPGHTVCQPPTKAVRSATSSASSSPSSSSSSAAAAALSASTGAAQMLEVPMRALEATTLARVAEFLVVKCTLASHPHYLHETDVFGDLDRTSERDQLTAMQVLLGADFLNC